MNKSRKLGVRRLGPDLVFVTITQVCGRKKEVTTYSVMRYPDDGPAPAYSFGKHGGGYHKVSYDPGTDWRCCDCRGFRYHGFCKHADAVPALYARGKLPDQEPR